MAGTTCITLENFLKIHHQQLQSIGLPEQLWVKLYNKLAPKQIRDAGTAFELQKGEELSDGRPAKWSLHTKESLDGGGDVFLIDHAWTSDGGHKAKEMLWKKPEVVKRMNELMCIVEDVDEDLEFLDQNKVVQQILEINESEAKKHLEKTSDDIIEAIVNAKLNNQEGPKLPQLDEPLSYEDFKSGFEAQMDETQKKFLSEEFMGKMYVKYLKDREEEASGVQYGSGSTTHYSWEEPEDWDGSITVLISVPSDTKKSSIFSKVMPQEWKFGVDKEELIINGKFYSKIAPDECFWTFDGPGVIQMTLQKIDPVEGLWPVLIKGEKQFSPEQIFQKEKEEKWEKNGELINILDEMWYYNQTYQAVMVKGGPQEHLWYIMDEVGSALTHSTSPNIKCAPFAYAVGGVVFSLIWPITDIQEGAVCTRSFCPPLTLLETQAHTDARLMACSQVMPDKYPMSFLQEYSACTSTAKYTSLQVTTELLVSDNKQQKALSELKLTMKFYIDKENRSVKSALSDFGCSFVEKPEEATALWVHQPTSKVAAASQKVNYLGGDECLVRRDVLSRLIQKKLGEVPWYPVSYNLRSQLPAFCVEHYMKGIQAIWIIRSANPKDFHFKPVISSNLRRIIRLGETGPLVASCFDLSVALVFKKHFCLEYTVVVQSLNPLELLIHNTPRIRKAPVKHNNLTLLDEYDSKLYITVDDNSSQDSEVFEDFLKDFHKNYLRVKNQTWEEVQKGSFKCIYELFLAISTNLTQPGKGMNEGDASGRLSAVYGIDVLILEDLSSLITSVNPVPSFANNQVMKEVLYLAFSDQEYSILGSHVTKVTGNK